MEKKLETTIVYWVFIGYNGKENGNYSSIMGYMRNDIHDSGQNERNHPPTLPMCPKSPMYLHCTKYDFCGSSFPHGLVQAPALTHITR